MEYQGMCRVFLCQKQLRLSWKLDECKPLGGGAAG